MVTNSINDDMANEWGVRLVMESSEGTDRLPSGSMYQFDAAIRRTVPGFALHTVLSAGTYVNMSALEEASDYNMKECLFALGSYCGGSGYLQEMSTSMYDASNELSIPRYFDTATPRCRWQTAPMPYYVPNPQFTEEEENDLEEKCLRSLHKKLLIGKLTGKPFRALLMEYILGGNGGMLSPRYLKKLGTLCKQMDVVIVADEVLTGGRVGPGMVMTTSMPPEFLECVKFITVGKFLGCAVILKQIPKKPTRAGEKLRGTSTSQHVGSALRRWERCHERQEAGDVEKRRSQVVRKLHLKKKEHWGKGLLMFCTLRRSQNGKSLKNRLLPMLATDVALDKQHCARSAWTRCEVTKTIVGTTYDWLTAQDSGYHADPELAFLSEVVDFLFSAAISQREKPNTPDAGYIRFRPNDVITYIGPKKAEKLAKQAREMKVRQGFLCGMNALSFVKQAVFEAHTRTAAHRYLYKKKKTHARKEFTFFDLRLLGVEDSKGNMVLWS